MSNCSNCFNGCTEIVSDKCVKYTGINIPALGIETGDTLASVEQAITTYLISVLNGSGVIIDLTGIEVCNVVNKYLPVCSTCTEVSIEDISTALIEASCDLQEQIDAIVADIVLVSDELDIINADYTVGCLIETTPSITPSSGTHAILQATINALCSLALELRNQYSSNGTELDNYIANYLANLNALVSSKMIPYVAVPYFNPDLSNFNGTGAGIGNWSRIFLCNGQNPGVPDLRGRVLVGATTGMGNAPMDPQVTPGGGNPNYALNSKFGLNEITLVSSQIPLHTHPSTVVSTAAPHAHQTKATTGGAVDHNISTSFYYQGNTWSNSGNPSTVNSGVEFSNITINTTVTNAAGPVGGGNAHANNQPAIGCYYIIYIP